MYWDQSGKKSQEHLCNTTLRTLIGTGYLEWYVELKSESATTFWLQMVKVCSDKVDVERVHLGVCDKLVFT